MFPEGLSPLAQADPEVFGIIKDEEERQWWVLLLSVLKRNLLLGQKATATLRGVCLIECRASAVPDSQRRLPPCNRVFYTTVIL